MTISSEAIRVSYQGDGATSEFAFGFVFNSADDIRVSVIDSDGTETVLSSGYTLTPNSEYPSTGGTIIYPSSGTDYLDSDSYIAIQRNNELIQDTSFAYGGTSLNPKTIETALDTLTQLIQQVNDLAQRSPKMSVSDTVLYGLANVVLPNMEDGKTFYWDETTKSFKTVDVVKFASTLESADAAAASATEAASSAAEAASSAAEAATNMTGVFTGVIQAYAGTTAPFGYLFCQGQTVDRTTYANLFNIIGTTYGAGNGTTTFNVPDLIGRFPVGFGAGTSALGTQGGEASHVLTTDEMPSHDHTAWTDTQGDHQHSISGRRGVGSYDDTTISAEITNNPSSYETVYNDFSGAHAHNVEMTTTGGNVAHNNMPPYLVVNYIIKY